MEELIWTSDFNSMLSSHLGRVMNTLLSSRPKKLQDAISRIGSDSARSVSGSLEEPLLVLRKYVKDAVEKGEKLDEVLVPIIQSSLKSKDSRQVLVLLNWLFQDDLLFEPLSTNLAKMIAITDDRYISLGWCSLIRRLMDHDTISNQFPNSGLQERQKNLLKILFPFISHLSSAMCNGSTLQGRFELPTRLAVAAADCILVLTETSIKACTSGVSSVNSKPSGSDAIKIASNSDTLKKAKSRSNFSLGPEKLEMGLLLWDLLDELIILVQRLLAWSRKSRPLHAKGLEQVLKWLQEIKQHYGSVKDEAGGNIVKSGVLLLSSCWKHYCMLLRLDDQRFSQCYMEMLNQYISGIQYYMDDYATEHSENEDGGIETRKFFLSCICLLLGRLESKQFETAMSKHELEMSQLLLSQLQCTDEDVIEGAVSILRATIFTETSSRSHTQQMETLFPLLLNLLDERDRTARAVVMLTAEYCSIDDQRLLEVFKRLGSGNSLQRRNALDVISEFMHNSLDSGNLPSLSVQKDIAKNLVDRLGDEEPDIRIQASKVLPTIEPALFVPELVHLAYNERVRSSAGDALLAVLKCHSQNPEVIVMLLDSLSQLCQNTDQRVNGGELGTEYDSDRILGLIPEWSKSVQDWTIFIEPLVDKMFAEPTNAIIIRFLSCVSENIAATPDLVLQLVLLRLQRQEEMDEKLPSHGANLTTNVTYGSDNDSKLNNSLFDRLCPLLLIRLLPLRVFDDLTSSVVYGPLLDYDSKDLNDVRSTCIAALLLNRAFHKYEFDDVRKLAAELCGRVHPQVLLPIIQSQLEQAVCCRDILKMKACLFSVCTSLVVRGIVSASFPVIHNIRLILETVLLWPSVDGDEVSKAQHGCIDCLALMICAELQSPQVANDSSTLRFGISGEKSNGDAFSWNSVLSCVFQKLTNDKSKSAALNESVGQSHLVRKSDDESEATTSIPLSLHLCMANVLISACQKISTSGKKPLADKMLPVLIRSVKVITDSDIRAACIQVLFSAVYHLKSAILPYTLDLLKLSVKALRKGSEKEKMASVKLMASLMASEDTVLESLSGGLLEARAVLSDVSSTHPSPELRQVCQKLLVCMMFP